MIATDSSTFIAFLGGDGGADIDLLRTVLLDRSLVMPPPVIAELLSSPKATPGLEDFLRDVQQMPIAPGFWERAGRSRALLKSRGLKAKLADALVAQCCIDADVPLIARDGDFRHFARWCGLKLA